MSLCPDPSYPMASMTTGVTEMMEMMTIEEKTRSIMVEKTRALMSVPDYSDKVDPFLI